MYQMPLVAKTLAFALASLFFVVLNPAGPPDIVKGEVTEGPRPENRLGLTAAARQALQETDKAFPADEAGFSAYYRMVEEGSHSLEKGKVDNYIFSPIISGDTTVRTGPAKIVEVGDNYTVATLSLINIDNLTSKVNLYYDDQGWIVAYLPNDAPSSQIWQAREEDEEDPEVRDISNTTLLEAINVVVDDALKEMAIAPDDSGLGYYHWQHTTADNFLMMAIARTGQGEYPVQFAVPESLAVSEVSASMWISQGANVEAPCAKVTLDSTDLIAKKCERGIYSESGNLEDFKAKTAHSWKLIHSKQDGGGSGSLLMILYSSSGN